MIPMKAYISNMNIAVFLTVTMALSVLTAVSKVAVTPEQPVKLFPLRDIRLLESPFSEAIKANRQYLLAHDPDRLLAPFRREAGLKPKACPYGNWESGGLDGHSAGHYLSALSLMAIIYSATIGTATSLIWILKFIVLLVWTAVVILWWLKYLRAYVSNAIERRLSEMSRQESTPAE